MRMESSGAGSFETFLLLARATADLLDGARREPDAPPQCLFGSRTGEPRCQETCAQGITCARGVVGPRRRRGDERPSAFGIRVAGSFGAELQDDRRVVVEKLLCYLVRIFGSREQRTFLEVRETQVG